MRIFRTKEILIVFILLMLFLMGSVAATDDTLATDLNTNADSQPSISENNDSHNTNTVTTTNKTVTTNKTTNSTTSTVVKKTVPNKLDSGCNSVIVHVKKGHYVYAYRRDSSYAANLYIKKVIWYGKEVVKEYKKTNGYFFHTIVVKNGWFVGTGGPDVVYLNKYLEKLAGRMVSRGRITKASMNSAYRTLRKLGMGHFIIKSPSGYVGMAVYNRGSKVRIFKMKDGEYISLPNSPRHYRRGKFASMKSNPVSAAIHIAGTDRWGVNRRNILTYEVKNINYTSRVRIWATYDNGKLLGRRSRGRPDNIIFRGRKISAKSIPTISRKKFIGEVILRNRTSVAGRSVIAVPV
ncbi:MAG: hypothetical protein Q8M06_05785 [Methanobacteriaceae archaeon]|nr:hypothetical protein [Methanobacteriaceae archaeon]